MVLLPVLIPTITTLYDHDAAAEEGDIVIDVYGKQWWWEVRVRRGQGPGGRKSWRDHRQRNPCPGRQEVIFNLRTNNVIHSFWVPRLSGKLDLVPGHNNKLSITATEAGTYYGECAEFCGAQHAWMRFTIIAQPEDEFYAWVNAQRVGNPATTNADAELPEGVALAPKAFNLCLSCHTVNGITPYVVTGLDAASNSGPDLTNVSVVTRLRPGCSSIIARIWRHGLMTRVGVKPGNYMAEQITPGLIRDTYGDEGFDERIDFLETLQPEGGCIGSDTVGGATPVASPVADE